MRTKKRTVQQSIRTSPYPLASKPAMYTQQQQAQQQQQPSPPLTAQSSPVAPLMSDTESDAHSSPLFTPESSPVPMSFSASSPQKSFGLFPPQSSYGLLPSLSSPMQSPRLSHAKMMPNGYPTVLATPELAPFRPPQQVTLPPISTIMKSLFI
ncbi:hypothetical protein BGW42_006330 [Actinomortierella wolfii]|nr:hypothetical protein BGW42_006330 [Actinomortierella wolfii]